MFSLIAELFSVSKKISSYKNFPSYTKCQNALVWEILVRKCYAVSRKFNKNKIAEQKYLIIKFIEDLSEILKQSGAMEENGRERGRKRAAFVPNSKFPSTSWPFLRLPVSRPYMRFPHSNKVWILQHVEARRALTYYTKSSRAPWDEISYCSRFVARPSHWQSINRPQIKGVERN